MKTLLIKKSGLHVFLLSAIITFGTYESKAEFHSPFGKGNDHGHHDNNHHDNNNHHDDHHSDHGHHDNDYDPSTPIDSEVVLFITAGIALSAFGIIRNKKRFSAIQ